MPQTNLLHGTKVLEVTMARIENGNIVWVRIIVRMDGRLVRKSWMY